VSVVGDTLVYRAGPGPDSVDSPQERVEIKLRPRRSPTHAVVSAEGPGPHHSVSVVSAGPGCGGLPSSGTEAPTEVRCPLLGVNRFRVHLSGDHDQLYADPGLRGTIFGGDGVDGIRAEGTIYGGAGNDFLTALGVRGKVFGGPGRDSLGGNGALYGGPGDDSLSAGSSGTSTRQRLFGGPGRDELSGSSGPDVLAPGPGQDEVRLARDNARDRVMARDGESDDIWCATATNSDRLMLDGSDWPSAVGRAIRCKGLSRSSPAMAVPVWILSPDYERSEYGGSSGTWVGVGCPFDAVGVCEGTIVVRVRKRRLGPKRFAVRAGRIREFEVAPESFDSCDDVVPTIVTLRTRHTRGVFTVTRSLDIEVCPYDSA
jgi:hypothetical protein